MAAGRGKGEKIDSVRRQIADELCGLSVRTKDEFGERIGEVETTTMTKMLMKNMTTTASW